MKLNRKFSVAPMMEWTDRHCRFFHRLLTRRALLYTEMLTTGAVLHGDRARLLRFDAAEHPVALQLGGSDPRALAACARIGAELGFDEINLNAGCPSDRVQDGRFGACLMAEPALVGDCVAAMKAAVSIPVTVKCRIGIDEQDPEEALEIFAQNIEQARADALIVHARKAWLKGLSPKENREVPPLDYARVYRLKAAHPQLAVVLNGGVASVEQALAHLQHVDGVMMGRAAYQEPWRLIAVDPLVFGEDAPFARRKRPPRRSPLISNVKSPTARGCMPSRGICTACSARCPARALTAGISPAPRQRRKPAPNSSPRRSRLSRTMVLDSERGIGAHRRVTRAPAAKCNQSKNDSWAFRCSELLWLALAIVVGGVITGLLAGLFGIGGGAVIVPVLYEVFRILDVPEAVRMQLCVGTSLAIIVPTTIQSYLTHRAKGLVVPRRDPAVGAASRARRRLRRGHRVLCAGCRVQDCLRGDRNCHRDQISVRRRPLESRHRTARPRADDGFTASSSGSPVR